MLKATNRQVATIIREICEGGVEKEWESGISKILSECDANPDTSFQMCALTLSNASGLPLEVCDMVIHAILES